MSSVAPPSPLLRKHKMMTRMAVAAWSVSVFSTLMIQEVAVSQTLFINECMAANSMTIADPDYHDYADWIEVYNAGDSSVNLKGYSVTDLFSQPQKYRFAADMIVPPHSWAIIWADDRNTGNHTNFKLSASGEVIGLFDAAGNIVDTLSFGAQTSDVSYGRFPDGSSNWFRFSPAVSGNDESRVTNL